MLKTQRRDDVKKVKKPPKLTRRRVASSLATRRKTKGKVSEEIDIDVERAKIHKAALEFRDHVYDMWRNNTSSANFVQALASKAQAAGASGIDGIAKIGKSCELPKNLSRDLMRQGKTNSSFPPTYHAGIPCWNEVAV